MHVAPGKIRNRSLARRLRDFSGLRYGRITPTDVDALLDFRGEVFVIIEVKRMGAPMPFGQRLALERVCSACNAGGVSTTVLVGEYDEELLTADGDIDVAKCTVREIHTGRHVTKWRPPRRSITIREAVDSLVRRLRQRELFGLEEV